MYYLQYIKNDIMDLAQYTVGLGHINQPKIRAIQVPVPPVEVQKRVVEKCEYYDSIIDRLKEEIQDLQEPTREWDGD